MIRWVVTGPIGAGKSTVTGLLRERGAVIVDADRLGHEVLADPEVVTRIVAEFGPEVAPGGVIDRAVLGPRVFADSQAMARLNALTHGRISALAQARLGHLAREGKHDLAVLEAAVYFLFPSPPEVDLVISVVADEAVRRQRLGKDRGLDSLQVDARLAAQADLDELWHQADVVLDNSGGIELLRDRVEKLLAKYLKA